MSIIRVLTGLLICISFSCNQKKVVDEKNQFDDLERDKYQIITLLIEKVPPGPPPPPPPGVYEKDTIAFNRYVDSIYKLDINIGIIDNFFVYDDKILDQSIENEYQTLIEELKSIKENSNNKIELEKIQVKENRKITAFNSADNARQLLLGDSLDYVMRFSEIVLNGEKNRAVVVSSAYPHPKGGNADLYMLKKEKGIWKIFRRKTLSIS